MYDLERSRGYQKTDHIAPPDGFESIDEFVDEDSLLILDQRGHTRSFHLHRLVEENDNDHRQAEGDDEVARPGPQLAPDGPLRRGLSRFRIRLNG